MTGNGLITLASVHDVGTTLDRLTAALEAKGVTVFARNGLGGEVKQSVNALSTAMAAFARHATSAQ